MDMTQLRVIGVLGVVFLAILGAAGIADLVEKRRGRGPGRARRHPRTEESGESVLAVRCSECGRDLRKLQGGLFQEIPEMEQWFGNVCVPCGRVYCDQCLELGGPTPCPHCGSPTEPAQRMVLRQIGKAP